MANKKRHLNLPRISKKLSVAKTILAILAEIKEGTIKSFFPHPYYHTFCSHNSSKHKDKDIFSSNIIRLEKRGLIIRKKKEGATIFYLTPSGEKEAFLAQFGINILTKNNSAQKWDGKWRFIFFDIPETKRHYRLYLRRILKTLGFKEFQKSVWVYPFQIPTFISEILWDEEIRPYTRFVVVGDIDYDYDLRKLFSLGSS